LEKILERKLWKMEKIEQTRQNAALGSLINPKERSAVGGAGFQMPNSSRGGD
jgi:hypothetical protein